MNNDEWSKSAGQSGPSENDEREDIGRSEEGDGERNGDDGKRAEAFGPHVVAEFEVVTEDGGATEDFLQIIRGGIDLLAEQRYEDFIRSFGYSLPNGEPCAEWILEDLARCRSELYSGVEHFEVTD
jgi:hypothetical protein